MSDIAEGVRYATKDKVLRVILVLGLVTSLLAQPYQSILPVFARDVLDRKQRGEAQGAEEVDPEVDPQDREPGGERQDAPRSEGFGQGEIAPG